MSPMRGFAAALLLWAVLAAPCAPHHRRGVCGASASVWLPALARQDDRPGCPSVADPAATREAPPPRLRGLGVLRGGGAVGAGAEIRVPSESFPTLQDALDATCADDTCVVSRGCHSFGLPGPYPMEERTLCLHGDEGAWIMGRWFCERSTCNMTRINLYADEAQAGEDDEIMSGRVVVVVEGSWALSESAVQCVDGIPLALLDRSTVSLDSCVIGGSGGNDTRLARVGITVGDDSKVTISKSTVTWCKQFGITVSENTLLQATRSSIIDNKIGVSIEGDCRVYLELTAFTSSASSLKIEDRYRYTAKVSAKKCKFDATVWFCGVMPVRDPGALAWWCLRVFRLQAREPVLGEYARACAAAAQVLEDSVQLHTDDPPDILGTDEYSEPNCLQDV